MILDKNRLVLNDQSISSSHNEPQRLPGFVQKQSPEMFYKKKEFLKILQISEENICLSLFLITLELFTRYSKIDVLLWNLRNF